ncbi:hypothetical protein GCM10011502_14300 [Oceanisphaera marina]|uniref:Uncharacterized protein n=1 Tax=Oceanisphaera marina TaxID=2017550 RepID=A0ABQ1IIB1_9GAMM|nr:hypothetical protein [Oceanisphaera marina]GGB42106.1 hypothetical protein GCM10011502_14300 [Oceanisphaera marina]
MRHTAYCSFSVLGLALALTACGTPPPPPKPTPVVVATPKPKPVENEVISIPESPIQTLPSDW